MDTEGQKFDIGKYGCHTSKHQNFMGNPFLKLVLVTEHYFSQKINNCKGGYKTYKVPNLTQVMRNISLGTTVL